MITDEARANVADARCLGFVGGHPSIPAAPTFFSRLKLYHYRGPGSVLI